MKTWREMLDEFNSVQITDKSPILHALETLLGMLEKFAAEEEARQPAADSRPYDRDERITNLRRALGSSIAADAMRAGRPMSNAEIEASLDFLEKEGI